jgi:hypothetical protein
MPDVARLRLLELRPVLLVVGLDVLVRDLDLARDLLEDLLREHPRAEHLQHLLLRLAGVLELLLVGLLVAAEVLLLELVQARLDLLVAHGDVELLRRDLVLGLLDEVADDRVPKLRELGRPGRGELLLALLEGRLRLGQKAVVLGLRDRDVADDGDRVRRHVRRLAFVVIVPAAADDRDAEGERSQKSYQTSPKRHGRS